MVVRILQVVTYMGRGGLETMLMNYYRHMDRDKVQFDFLVHRGFEADYDQEILSMGGKIYRMPQLNPLNPKYSKAIDAFFKEHHQEYQIVHCHLDCMAGIPLKYAEKYGIPIRIAHAHNSNQTKDKKYLLKLLYKRNIPRYANRLFACGQEAGEWMFGGRKFSILNNAIDTSLYAYNPKVRVTKRKELNISETTMVVGHVGLFRPQKNHEFIIKVFSEMVKRNKDAVLMLVGDGELKENMIQLAKELNIYDHVKFLGVREDVAELLQTMDVFLFPSYFEGLSLSIIEAQAAGLPCVISDSIPEECIKTELVERLSLNMGSEYWAKKVLSTQCIARRDTTNEIACSGFDINKNALKLQKYYLKLYHKSERVDHFQISTEMKNDIRITVFTPAYNRAHTLPRTYESLKKQDCKKFIWLIVDDGSSDNTAELVKQWQSEGNDFEIRYIYKENGGMHTAHNTAYENIDTELNICIDSDDCLTEGAITAILEQWAQVKDKGYAGIIGLDADLNGNIIGKGFPDDLKETTLTGYYAAGGSGDKKLVYRTDVIKSYPPYPVFEGERYVALAYKYRLVDQDYKLAVLNKVLCNVEYQADGSSGTMWKQYLKNPNGFAFWRKVCMTYPTDSKRLFIDCIHYVSSSIIAKNSKFIAESPQKILTIIALPFGIVLTLAILIKDRR